MKAESLPSRLAAEKRLVMALGNTTKCLQNTSRSFGALAKALHYMASTEPLDYRSAVLNGAASARHFEDLLSEIAISVDAGRLAFSQISKSVTKRAMVGFKVATKLHGTASAEQANEIISTYTDFEEEHIRALRSCFEGLARLAKATGQSALSAEYLTIASSFRPESAKAITLSRYRGLVREATTVTGASTLILDRPSGKHDESIMSTGEYIFNSQDRGKQCQASSVAGASVNLYQNQHLSGGHRARVFQVSV
ncbi:Hypothetical protein GLP15_3170 [Giardia lamblia P15]|uniref:Uncharacterized protein n=1 Tax=Giardia intestinalis (strain P15) TaxID=658858 RepID=E1F7L5_GIAIA|nr:Hypothetical protein GLP15_3170 [Giardia lamblia P15]